MIYSDTMAFLSSPQDFMFQSHEDLQGGLSPTQMMMRRSMSFSGVTSKCDEDYTSDDGLPLGEKKRRLNVEQVKALEKSFELGNKLEPERKTQLARALGLQPRQVAIWFQNRRARWKTKQLERDYDVLKRKLEGLKADNDTLHEHNRKLQAELVALKSGESTGGIGNINLNTETDHQGNSWSNGSDQNSNCDVFLGTTRTSSTPLLLYPQHQVNNNNNTASLTHLLQSSSSSRSDRPSGPDEALCTMFGGISDQPGFWSWPEQQQLN